MTELNPWKMSDIQLKKCKDYLKGKVSDNDMRILYKTYQNEYIEKFSYESRMNDPIKTILNNFCKEAIQNDT